MFTLLSEVSASLGHANQAIRPLTGGEGRCAVCSMCNGVLAQQERELLRKAEHSLGQLRTVVAGVECLLRERLPRG